uniref:Keratin associated protein 22-2 n=1 Tax=Aotus nancymaae TaxID=37293 RepID=A0A2K5CPL8_AOTNA
ISFYRNYYGSLGHGYGGLGCGYGYYGYACYFPCSYGRYLLAPTKKF